MPGGSALSFFLRGFFFSLSLEQRDLLDASRVGRAPGRDVGIIFERVVDEPPLVRIHRLELKRPAGNTNAIGQFSHALHDAIFAHGAVMFAIDNDLFGIFVFSLEETVQQKLDGLECFPITADQAAAFLGVNLERQVAPFVLHLLDLDNETEVTEHGVE